MDFLDVTVTIASGRLVTKTFEKAANLYLYPAAHSSQPPGLLKGIVYGLVQNYHRHNTLRCDLMDQCAKLIRRLAARGHCPKATKRFVAERLRALDTGDVTSRLQMARRTQAVRGRAHPPTKKLFLKLPYDPSGPTRHQLRRGLRLREIESELSTAAGRTVQCVICYKNPPSLHALLNFHAPPDMAPTSLRLVEMRPHDDAPPV